MELSKEERLIVQREKETELKNKIDIVLNMAKFTHLCKFAFFVVNTETGRFDISIDSSDILKLCRNEIVEKLVYEKTYRFVIDNISNEDLIEIIKRSTMFSGLAEKI